MEKDNIKNIQNELNILIMMIEKEHNFDDINNLFLSLKQLSEVYNSINNDNPIKIYLNTTYNPDDYIYEYQKLLLENNINEFFKNKKTIFNITQNFLALGNEIEEYPINFHPIINKYNKKDAYNIIREFFHKFDPALDHYINSILNDKHILYYQKNNDISGYCSNIGNLKKQYFLINNNKNYLNYYDIETIVHEISHGIDVYLNHHNNDKRKELIHGISLNNEIFPEVLREIFNDFIVKYNIDTDNAKVETINKIDNIILTFVNINIISRLNKTKVNKDLSIDFDNEELNNLLNLYNIQDNIINTDFILDYKYTIARYLGFFFNDMYQNDPEYTKNNLYTFIKEINYINDFAIFNKYGLNENELFKNEAIIKKMKTL